MRFHVPRSARDAAIIEQVIAHNKPERVGWTAEQVREQLRAGLLHGIVVQEQGISVGAFLFSLDWTRRGNETLYVEWFAAFDDLAPWLDEFLGMLTRYAAEMGNKHLTFSGRRGFSRRHGKIFRKHGITTRLTLYWRDLEQKPQ